MTLEPQAQDEILDRGVRELRDLQVDPERIKNSSDSFFAALDAQAPGAAASRPVRPWWHLPVGMAAAAAAAVILTLRFQDAPSAPVARDTGSLQDVAVVETPPPESKLIELGGRVAMLASPTSNYVIESVSAAQTKLRVQAGDVTVRLFRDTSAPYDLVVSAGEYSFAAMGTVYTVTYDEVGPSLAVHEGEVWVRDAKGELVDAFSAGEVWPEGSQTTAGADAAAEQLQAHALSMPPLPPEDQTPGRSASARREKAPPPPPTSSVPESLPQKWQRARLLRGQSKPEQALLVLEELASSEDPTWAPLAVIEQIRIHRESPAGLPNRASDILRLTRKFTESWGDHPLAGEVAAMVCPLLKGQRQPSMALCQTGE